MRKPLSFKEFDEILKIVEKGHRFGGLSGTFIEPCKHVKYIRPQIDMRDKKVFRIEFNGFVDKVFDFRDEGNMKENIVKWLES